MGKAGGLLGAPWAMLGSVLGAGVAVSLQAAASQRDGFWQGSFPHDEGHGRRFCSPQRSGGSLGKPPLQWQAADDAVVERM